MHPIAEARGFSSSGCADQDMRRDDLQRAVAEAKRFLERAERALSADHDPDYPWIYGPEAAAVKRSSMDLTKALPKVRRNR